MTAEDRTAPRKSLRCQAMIAFSGAAPLRVKTRDVALGGVCVLVPEQVATGRPCMVMFEAPLNGKVVRVTGVAKVIYSILSGTDGFRTGLQFVQIDAANSKTLADLVAS